MNSKSPQLIAILVFFVLVAGGGFAVLVLRNNFVVENTAAAPHEPVVYLTAQNRVENPEDLVAPEPAARVKVLSNEVGYLNVRQGPGTTNAKVGQVDIGQEFAYTETQNNWYHIVFEEGKTGWVSGQYVQEVAVGG